MQFEAVLAQWMHYGGNAGWMWIPMALFWIAVIAVGVAMFRATTQRDTRSATARDILAERYARGEIDADELQCRTRELEKVGR